MQVLPAFLVKGITALGLGGTAAGASAAGATAAGATAAGATAAGAGATAAGATAAGATAATAAATGLSTAATTALGTAAALGMTKLIMGSPKAGAAPQAPTRDDAAAMASRADALARRRGSAADIMTGSARGAEVAGGTARFVLGN